MNIEKNKQLVKGLIHAMGEGDSEAIVAAYHPEGTVWTTGSTLISGVRGVEEIKTFAPAVLDSFPNKLRFTINSMVAEGDKVAVECESDGDHISGKHYHNYYHFLFEIRDGKIYRMKEYMDTELVTEVLCGGQRPS